MLYFVRKIGLFPDKNSILIIYPGLWDFYGCFAQNVVTVVRCAGKMVSVSYCFAKVVPAHVRLQYALRRILTAVHVNDE